MIDTHCHLDVAAFAGDRDAVVARARAAGVAIIVVPAIRPASFGGVAALARRYPEVRVAFGVHPQVVPTLAAAEHAAVTAEGLATVDGVAAVAVGECGLDGATGDAPGQERLFRRHLAIARELGLPVLVHVLRAHGAAPRILAEERVGEVGGVMHSYSGGPELAPVYLDLGLHLSFAGPVTYENARRPVAAARHVPADRLLAETDAPDQAPAPHRGGRSEPAFVREVVAGLARARGETPAAVAAATAANARRLLRIE